jgi:hypothetical protein
VHLALDVDVLGDRLDHDRALAQGLQLRHDLGDVLDHGRRALRRRLTTSPRSAASRARPVAIAPLPTIPSRSL